MSSLSHLSGIQQPYVSGFLPSSSGVFSVKSALTALVLSSLPTLVESGPICYAACVSACELAFTQAALIGSITTANPLLIPILNIAGWLGCPTACAPVLAAPSP